ncbi:MAG TPA: LysM peptidoglycan-binding domain-containing protein [Phycisphaerae bacterium]|jgi:LysM repeat protein
MTREAKIGMLTGLGVIVVIGVLLSQYLGEQNGSSAGVNGATGRMAELPVGSAYREQVMSPMGVPPVAPVGRTVQLAGGGAIATPIGNNMPPSLYAADATDGSQQPEGTSSMNGPVAPTVGPMVADARGAAGGPPTITVHDLVAVKARPADPAPAAVTYTIVTGDNLAKIAKKFYGSSKNSDVQRIVAANAGMLKDASSMLVAGKKLTIPGVTPPTPAKTELKMPAGAAGSGAAGDQVVIYTPMGSKGEAAPPSKVQLPGPLAVGQDATKVISKDMPKDAAASKKTYVVQGGDTLEKIAKKLSPTKSADMVQKLMALNGIKDAKNLQAGATLKLPT